MDRLNQPPTRLQLFALQRQPRGMTLLEVSVVTVIFSMIMAVGYGALQSVRKFSRTNMTQVELQEEARRGIERIVNVLQATGRFVDNGNKGFPKICKWGKFPNGYENANKHPAKNNPNAKPGSNANGGDPTLESDEILFKVPQFGADGLPALNNGAVVWSAEEYGLFIVKADQTYNNIEHRNLASGDDVPGDIICRYVDRIRIEEAATDPNLTSRQLRITLFLTRLVGDTPITVALSSVVDMRNTSKLE